MTNRQYQEFVDKGGYQKREYWKEKFLRDGKELSWEQAMDLFRDSSRPARTIDLGGGPLSGRDRPIIRWAASVGTRRRPTRSSPARACR